MSFSVKSQLALLQVLKDASPKLQKAIIKNADPEIINAFSEICHNYVCSNIDCSKSHFKKLNKYKATVRKLAAPNKKKEVKRRILLQSGHGFIGVLLAPIIGELVSHLAQKVLK